MNSPKLSPDCAICCSRFTSVKRAPIECPRCAFRACRECLQKYVLSQETLAEIQCMMPNCDCAFDRPFLVKNLTQVFMNKIYREHRCQLLYHRERSRMPETMPYVERRKECVRARKKKEVVKAELALVNAQYQKLREEMWRLDRNIYRLERNSDKIPQSVEREFIRACPADECRGFLSQQWKCKVCDIVVCSKCHEIKGPPPPAAAAAAGGGGEEHVCDENNLKTAQLLKRDTKPCPSCGSLIHKISGCDQMWCTMCHVAFSWRTGRQVNGLVHNPHFYEWQRQDGGGVAPRVPGDVPCGGFPRLRHFRRAIYFLADPTMMSSDNPTQAKLVEKFIKSYPQQVQQSLLAGVIFDYLLALHRCLLHFRRVEMPLDRHRGTPEEIERDLRVDYMLQECSEENFKKRIIANDIRFTKENDIHHVMELMGAVALESILAIYNAIPEEYHVQRAAGFPTIPPQIYYVAYNTILEAMNKLFRVRKYCNNELKKISRVYNQCVPFISENFTSRGMKFKKKDLGW